MFFIACGLKNNVGLVLDADQNNLHIAIEAVGQRFIRILTEYVQLYFWELFLGKKMQDYDA